MRSVEEILVGVDGSEASLRAVDWAATEAASRGARVVVCCVGAQGPVEQAMVWEPDFTEQHATDIAAHAVKRAQLTAPGISVSGRVAVGSVPKQLVQHAPRAGLLVVGSRGLGAFTGLLLGSVSEQVAMHAPCPVVVVRGESRNPALPIAVGVDGSPANTPAVEYAFEAADRLGVPLVALTVVTPMWIAPPIGYPMAPVPDAGTLTQAAGRLLDDAVRPWAEKYPQVSVERRPLVGRTARSLIEASSSASLLVVGSRGHGDVAGLLLGSVSGHVLRHSDCPVAVVRG
jgi:nucleotide-binding universal stress UspA family protein